jgi:hypothetical protein
VCLGASGPSGGRSLFDVEQQLVEAILLDTEGEQTNPKRVLFPGYFEGRTEALGL